MEPRSAPANTVWPFPFTPQDWEQTPPTVQAYVRTLRHEVTQLHDSVETLEARLTQNATTSSRPPSSDSPYKKPRRRTAALTPRKAGGKPGHPGHRQALVPPTTVQELRRRSKEAFAALIDDWAGILVSDGYGVYQHWVQTRQTCVAHLIRTARSLAERQNADLAACGVWALAELQRLCHMAKAPPTGEEWRAWYARLCKLIEQYHNRYDDAGRFARRLLREMDSLWIFLAHHGVEPTKNRAERALRFGVLWRKRSLGTTSEKGNRWVERILSLRATCRLQAKSTYTVLVEAMTSLFHGQPPDLSWINAGVSTSAHPL